LVTNASAAKAEEPIEMPFGVWTLVDPRKDILHGAGIETVGGTLGGIQYMGMPNMPTVASRDTVRYLVTITAVTCFKSVVKAAYNY